MLSQVVMYHVEKQREARHEMADTSRVHDFLRMNPPSFTGWSTIEDSENFVDDVKKVFDKMNDFDVKRVELELRLHNIQVGLFLKKPFFGVSFLDN